MKDLFNEIINRVYAAGCIVQWALLWAVIIALLYHFIRRVLVYFYISDGDGLMCNLGYYTTRNRNATRTQTVGFNHFRLYIPTWFKLYLDTYTIEWDDESIHNGSAGSLLLTLLKGWNIRSSSLIIQPHSSSHYSKTNDIVSFPQIATIWSTEASSPKSIWNGMWKILRDIYEVLFEISPIPGTSMNKGVWRIRNTPRMPKNKYVLIDVDSLLSSTQEKIQNNKNVLLISNQTPEYYIAYFEDEGPDYFFNIPIDAVKQAYDSFPSNAKFKHNEALREMKYTQDSVIKIEGFWVIDF